MLMTSFNLCKNMYKDSLHGKFVVVTERIAHKAIYHTISNNEIFYLKLESQREFKEKPKSVLKRRESNKYIHSKVIMKRIQPTNWIFKAKYEHFN